MTRLKNWSAKVRLQSRRDDAAQIGGISAVVAMVAMLGGCAFAPGMRMLVSQSPVVASVSSGASAPAAAAVGKDNGASGHTDASVDSTTDASQSAKATSAVSTAADVPITELDVEYVRRMQQQREESGQEQARLLSDVPPPYTVGVGDVLQIVVWDHPELSAALGGTPAQNTTRPGDPIAGFVVDQSGDLTFPYAGTLHVASLRTEDVQKRLSAALGKYFVKPQVTVRMASYRAHDIYVDGEVHAPGVVAVNDVPMSLYEAIARAGGFSDSADQSALVLVRGGVSHPINLTQMLASGLNPSRLYLRSGDRLRIVARDENDVYVMGEVNKPVSAIPNRTGRITLADALSQAGSVNASTADAAQMFVVRGALNGTPQVFHLDGRSPVAMLVAKEFDLQPKDVVYVDGNGLVRFSRVLSLLLPAINAGMTAGILAK